MNSMEKGKWTTGKDEMEAPALAPVRRFIEGMDRREFLLRDCFVEAPSIVDAFAPFHWSGADALERWAREVEASIARSSITDYRSEILGIDKLVIEGECTYVSINLCYHITMSDHPEALADKGVFTFTLKEVGGEWRISSATWAGHVTT